MANTIYIPLLNPVNFYPLVIDQLPQYLTRHMEDYRYAETIQPWEYPVPYYQKVQTTDVTNLQFLSNFSQIQFEVIDEDGNVHLAPSNATQKLQNKYMPGHYAYEISLSWDDFDEGCYYIRLTLGETVMISEPILLKEVHENTVYLEYTNSRYHQSVIFETGIIFSFRVEGAFGKLDPASSDFFYDDQRFNPTILSSKPFDNYPLVFGAELGIPEWVIQKINYIFSCNNVLIDGKAYAKTSDSKFSLKEEDNYPLRGMEFTVRQGIHRGYKVLNPEIDTNQRMIIIHSIDSQLFGGIPGNPGSNTIQVINLE
jgi:hypothetical protein